MDKETRIQLIANRIQSEYKKHPSLDWARIAAGKIYAVHFRATPQSFAEWLYENRWFNFDGTHWHYVFPQGTHISNPETRKKYIKTTDELYKMFDTEQLFLGK